MNKELEKEILNWFAQRNQYSTWKEVIKDKQSLTFEAVEFENEIKEIISKVQEADIKEFKEKIEEEVIFLKDLKDIKRNGFNWKNMLRYRIEKLEKLLNSLDEKGKEK